MGKNNRDRRKAKKAAKEKKRVSLPVVPSVRSCDGCTACCSVFGVEEINKSPWIKCEHLNERGCSIYATRPRYCHSFYCLWQTGLGTAHERPDKLGVIFAPTNGKTEFTGETEIQVYEIVPHAFNRPDVIRLAKTFGDRGKLVVGHVYGGDSFRFVGPPDKIAKATRWLENQKK